MILESVSPIGTEQWRCTNCERLELRLTWHVDAKHIVVNPGDESVEHRSDGNASALAKDEEIRLEPWLRWLDEVDVDGWWS
jgi:hypothetical protein